MIREEPYPGLNVDRNRERLCPARDSYVGAAWLSSARAVRCRLSPITSATLVLSCQHVKMGTLSRLPPQGERKGGDDVKSARPLRPGRHTCYNGRYRGQRSCVMPSESQKAYLSSDWSLQPDSMKLDSLVIADQPCCGEYVPGPCTHRPSSHESWVPKDRNRKERPRANR
jgi:hypothetical protein